MSCSGDTASTASGSECRIYQARPRDLHTGHVDGGRDGGQIQVDYVPAVAGLVRRNSVTRRSGVANDVDHELVAMGDRNQAKRELHALAIRNRLLCHF